MSNALAIAAVTATLRKLIDSINFNIEPSLGHADITTKPPDKARDNEAGNQLNLFLYQVLPNAAWRNMDIPQKMRSGETSMPPLALNLYYMLTAYGTSNDDLLSHRLLGHAMNILYDHAILSSKDIDGALPPDNSELQNQVERVRITLQPLSVEEIFRLWSGFQTQYRVSVAYEVGVIPPFPTIEGLDVAHPPSALLGEDLKLTGHDLLPGPDPTQPADQQIDNSQTVVRFTNPRWATPREIPPKAGAPKTATELTVTLPGPAAADLTWPAGFYTLAVVYKNSSGKVIRTSNEMPFSLAPQILAAPPISATRSAGKVMVTLKCSPAVQQTVEQLVQGVPQTIVQAQHVALLLGDRQALFVFPASLAPVQDLTFTFDTIDSDIPAGKYFVRLRVDGVDSLLVQRTVPPDRTKPPTFDATQRVDVP